MPEINFTVNGRSVSVNTYPAKTLLDVLREDLDLTGSKECCGKGECGSCSVIVGDEVVCSCLILVGQIEGEEIQTVEGVGSLEQLDPLQVAFLECGATQCGYCTPGIIVAVKAYLEKLNRIPTQDEIKEALAGNLCRCTGYVKIIEAVAKAAKQQFV
ncbi:(2Fe-2S)-binding protein [Thermoflavimicrobium daqui]|uniref:Ferredoxin n=1 Tax=Thermoflavimicrobium daqui TaxID=2137476 RepID=A0A364K9U9_9BACL|nr:(2Fe-2S)-binding protein [Thermoflavimicrobium daqui]RAL27064.1 ferredoxin [Thermoflavimicrobium daqui]